MTSDIEAILAGEKPSQNQNFLSVSETIQSIWDKQHFVHPLQYYSFLSPTAKVRREVES